MENGDPGRLTVTAGGARWQPRKQLYPRDALSFADAAVQDKMVGLYRSLQATLPYEDGKVVSLLQLEQGQGGSGLIRELAKTVAHRLERRVLLLDATPHASLLAEFNVFPNYSWGKAYRDRKSVAEAVYQLGDSNLHVSQISRDAEAIDEVVEAPITAHNFVELRQIFDLVLVHAAPISKSTNGFALAGKVDGVVIVVESEKTRWRVARKLRDEIENQGGVVLGTVLNRRRHHLPQFIYDRL